MSQSRVAPQSPFVGPQAAWDALDASIAALATPGASPRLQPLPNPAVRGIGAAPASASPRLDECTLDANQRDRGGWFLKKTEGCGHVAIVLIEDIDLNMGPLGGKKGSLKQRDNTAEGVLRRSAAAAVRARTNMGWKLRMLRADRLWTLTKRGRIVSRDEATALWGEFERVMSRRFPWFKCVTVIEPHKLGGYHIHFAVNRWMDVNSVRLIWHRVLTGEKLRSQIRGADSPGNVDVKGAANGAPFKIDKLVNYLGKYLSKGFDLADDISVRYKRYFASKGIDAPTVTRRRLPVSIAGVAGIAHSLRTWLSLDGYVPGDLWEMNCVPGRRAFCISGDKPEP